MALDRIVVQITRGLAPAQAIADAAVAAMQHGLPYQLVSGHVAVEAKNMAARLALDAQLGLVLCEDDVLARPEQWHDILTDTTGAVLFADALCQNATPNTQYNSTGEFLYTGTILAYAPREVLEAAAAHGPLFVASDWTPDGDDLHMVGTNHLGWGSDVYFWQRIRRVMPRPAIRSIGQVGHIMHPLNSGRHDLAAPTQMTVL